MDYTIPPQYATLRLRHVHTRVRSRTQSKHVCGWAAEK